jgi:hypothetical protein
MNINSDFLCYTVRLLCRKDYLSTIITIFKGFANLGYIILGSS